jgi:hypothetical protein
MCIHGIKSVLRRFLCIPCRYRGSGINCVACPSRPASIGAAVAALGGVCGLFALLFHHRRSIPSGMLKVCMLLR